MRLLHLVYNNTLFQIRHGFYLVYLIISLSYVAILKMLPDMWAQKSFVLLIFSDISILGIFFIGAIVFLERDQGIMQALFVTPLSITDYIIAQVVSLTGLSLLMGLLIAFLRFGFSFNLIQLIVSIVVSSSLSILTGIAIAVKQRRVTSYFVLVTLLTIPFFLPLLTYLNLVKTSLFRVLPTDAVLKLLDGVFLPMPLTVLVLSILIVIVWGIFLSIFTIKRFDRYIIKKTGELR